MPVKKEKLSKLKKETLEVEEIAKKQLINYIIAAFSLVAGLAWNEAIKAILTAIFPTEYQGWAGKLIYAILISAIVVIASIILSKLKNIKIKTNGKN